MANPILSNVSHRPYPLPMGGWKYYQEWNDAIFLHWEVPYEVLRLLVPAALEIDQLNGNCYVSLVAFTMQRIRPKWLPAVSFISDFHEINIRTYVSHSGKAGVYFINIQAEKWWSSFIARMLSGLPYETGRMYRTPGSYRCNNARCQYAFNMEFEIGEPLITRGPADLWLTERYCLYLAEGGRNYRYDIQHREWGLRLVDIKKLELSFATGNLRLSNQPPSLYHYSAGVQVLAWGRQEI